MSNEKSKPSLRPYTKKKVQKNTVDETPSEIRRRELQSKSARNSSSGKRSSRRSLDVSQKNRQYNDFEPDDLTKRAVSKKQYTSDKAQAFASQHARGIIVLVTIVISIWLMYPAVRGYYASKRNLEIYTAVADYIATTNTETEAKIQNLNSEEGIKAHARDRGLVEPGEISIIIQEPEKVEQAEDAQSNWFNPFGSKDKPEESREDEQVQKEDAKLASKGVEEKEKMKKIAESIRDEASPSQKFLDFIFDYNPPDIKVF